MEVVRYGILNLQKVPLKLNLDAMHSTILFVTCTPLIRIGRATGMQLVSVGVRVIEWCPHYYHTHSFTYSQAHTETMI